MRGIRAGLAAAIVVAAVAIVGGATPAVADGPTAGTTGVGYWIASGGGQVAAFGDAGLLGDLNGVRLRAPIVGIAAMPGGQGFFLVGADGGVFAFGSAAFHGSMGGTHLNAPVVGIAVTPSGNGYWLVAADGGIFAFGDAAFLGSMGGTPLNQPITGIAVTPSGNGYWLVALDGGIFAFGDAAFHGSLAHISLNAPIVGMAPTVDGNGYWLVGADGGVFALGNAVYRGNAFRGHFGTVVAIVATPSGNGYRILTDRGQLQVFGDALECGRVFQFVDGSPGLRVISKEPGGLPSRFDAVGLAVPFDASVASSILGASCGQESSAFDASAPWHVDTLGEYCTTFLENSQGELLDAVQGSGHMQVRSTQMAGGTTFMIRTYFGCVAIARSGTGGTQSLPFTQRAGGDSLPFTSASTINISAFGIFSFCEVDVFADSDGHFVDGRFASHLAFTVPAGTYYIRSAPDCIVNVS